MTEYNERWSLTKKKDQNLIFLWEMYLNHQLIYEIGTKQIQSLNIINNQITSLPNFNNSLSIRSQNCILGQNFVTNITTSINLFLEFDNKCKRENTTIFILRGSN